MGDPSRDPWLTEPTCEQCHGSNDMLGYHKGFTNLHTHGWHVSPQEPADAAHLEIPAGQTCDYEYDPAY